MVNLFLKLHDNANVHTYRNHLSRKKSSDIDLSFKLAVKVSSFLPRGKSIPKTALLPAILSITKHQSTKAVCSIKITNNQSNKALRLRANTDFDSTRPHRQRNNRVYPKAVCINYIRGKKGFTEI